jgi:hypothetical protein
MCSFNILLLVFLFICFSNAQFGELKKGYPKNVPPGNPITDYDYYEIQIKNKTTKIAKRVRAILNTLNRPGNSHDFGSAFEAQMEGMHAIKRPKDGTGPKDEKGHIIGSQFNGPAVDYNMVPMGSYQNRNFLVKNVFMSSYYDMEMRMRDFIAIGCGSVDLKVEINYLAPQNNGQQSYRPKSFDMYHTFVYKINGEDMYQPNSHLFTSFENSMGLVNIPEYIKQRNDPEQLNNFNPSRVGPVSGTPNKKIKKPSNPKRQQVINGKIQHFKISADQENEDMRIKVTNQKDKVDKTIAFSRDQCVDMTGFPNLLANDITILKGQCLMAYSEDSCTGSGIVIRAHNLNIKTNISNNPNVSSKIKSIQSCCQNLGLSVDNVYAPYDFKNPVHRQF